MPANLSSPSGLNTHPDIRDPHGWYSTELTTHSQAPSVLKVLKTVGTNLSDFVSWPSTAILLWDGCRRVAGGSKFHRYTPAIRDRARKLNLKLDSRPNGPAIAAFLFGDGTRPKRYGSSNEWSIHHIYSGKFPHPGLQATSKLTHAAKAERHFTQSAGLVAVHPIADSLADEFAAFTWLLRILAFQKFQYDPDAVFGPVNEFGFAGNFVPEVVELAGPTSLSMAEVLNSSG